MPLNARCSLPRTFVTAVFALFALPSLFAGTNQLPVATGEHVPASGPTLHLDYGRGQTDNPLAGFMYFVALISPEPVSMQVSPGNNQRARVVSANRQAKGNQFVVTCQFEFVGEGCQRNVFDHSEMVRRHERELKAGRSLGEQLSSISVAGSGSGVIEVEGTTANGGVPVVNEVRLRFNGRGHASPVSIGLQEIAFQNGEFKARKEMVARVNTLTFKRQTGSPKMDVTVASVKPKDAGTGFWQNLKGSVLASAANLLIKPVAVEPTGHKAMLDFGLALASTSPAFTFPPAHNLRSVTELPGNVAQGGSEL